MYNGYVYNKEGLPLEGLKVSDGRHVCVTDATGHYTLPGWERESMIFVQALTRSHDDWYKRIEEGVSEYNFSVDLYDGGDGTSFIHISDTEIFINGAVAEDWQSFLGDCIAQESPDFLIHTGDICRRRGLEEHCKALCSESAGIPVRYTLGNHDYVNDVYGEYTFEKFYGPVWYSFDLGNMHYIVLPITEGEAPGRYEKSDRARWLIEDLRSVKAGQRIGVFCHTHGDVREELFTVEGEGFSVDLREHGILFWAFGHYHVNCINRFGDAFSIGTARPDVGGIDGTPAACRLVKIDKSGALTTKLIHNESAPTKCETKRYELGGKVCFASPIATEDGLIVATFSDGYPTDCGIHKLSYDGELMWKYTTQGSVKWNMAYEDGKLYAVDTSGNVYCLDSEGHEIFKTSLPCPDIRFVSGGVTLCDGLLYATSFYRLYEIDASCGALLRTADVKNSAAASTASPVVFGNRIYWGKHWDGLYAFERNSFSELWKCDEIKDSVAKPLICGGYIYAPTRYRIVKLTLDGEVVCRSDEYSMASFDTYSEAVINGGRLYVPTSDMGIAVFDAETLAELYRFDCAESLLGAATYTKKGAGTSLGKPLVIGDELIFTAVDGCVYFYNINTRALVRRMSVGHPITTGACPTPRGIAVVDFDGGVSLIELGR